MLRLITYITFFILTFSVSGQTISYTLQMEKPETHYFKVVIDVSDWKDSVATFVLPAWSPGRYIIYDFAKNIRSVSAVSGSHKLPTQKLDKQSWKVKTLGRSSFQFTYEVFANNLNGTFSVLDNEHANFNGASIFMYVDTYRQKPLTLTIQPFGQWKIINGVSTSVDQRKFQFKHYDELIDTPTEIGQFYLRTFHSNGILFRLAIMTNDPDTSNLSSLVSDTKAIVNAQIKIMGVPDLTMFTFLISFSEKLTTMGDGMEHFNSTQVIEKGKLSDADTYHSALETISHEFFHVWNIKRLRPIEYGPHNLTSESYSKTLWFGEGFTNYYTYYSLLKAGIISVNDFRDYMEKAVNIYENLFGKQVRSTEISSWDTWLYTGSQMRNSNSTSHYSYYTKGQIIGFLADAKIRKESNQQLSLDDVFRFMYKKFYQDEIGDWYAKGKGYTQEDIFESFKLVTGNDWSAWFEQTVLTPSSLPYEHNFDYFGIQWIQHEEKKGFTGLSLTQKNGFPSIWNIYPDSPAEKAGLQTDDEILGVNGQFAKDKNFQTLLPNVNASQKVELLIKRNDQIITKTLDIQSPEKKWVMIIDSMEQNELVKWLSDSYE